MNVRQIHLELSKSRLRTAILPRWNDNRPHQWRRLNKIDEDNRGCVSLWTSLQQQPALVDSKRIVCLWTFCMTLNTLPQAVLKAVFVHFLLQYNEPSRESGRKPVAGFFSEVTHLHSLFFIFKKHFAELKSVIKPSGEKCQGCTQETLWGAAFPICGERLIGQLGCFSPAFIEKAEDEMWVRWWETGQMVLKRVFQTTHTAFSIHPILASCPQEVLWEPSNHAGLVSRNQLT